MAELLEFSASKQTLEINTQDPNTADFVFPENDLVTLPKEAWVRTVGNCFVRAAVVSAVQGMRRLDVLGFASDELAKADGIPSPERLTTIVEDATSLGHLDRAQEWERRRNTQTLLGYGSTLLHLANWSDSLSEQRKIDAKTALELSSRWEALWGTGKLGSAHIESSAVNEHKVQVEFTASSLATNPRGPGIAHDTPVVQASGNIAFECAGMSTEIGEQDAARLRVSGNVKRISSDRSRALSLERNDPTYAAVQLAVLVAEIVSRPMSKRDLRP
ncbi:MAG TPA: hypothetical protein VLG92_03595 [Candidatus Saccharimonadia bacterium]|nr:hypothetical protein [Candidatus Saccharimonadia bacterium]